MQHDNPRNARFRVNARVHNGVTSTDVLVLGGKCVYVDADGYLRVDPDIRHVPVPPKPAPLVREAYRPYEGGSSDDCIYAETDRLL